MGEQVKYVAVYDYEKKAPQDIEMRVGDVMTVINPTLLPYFQGTKEEPIGWLEGLNERTQESGSFPGTFVKYVDTRHPPGGNYLQVDAVQETTKTSPRTSSPEDHHLIEKGLVTPILCKHCNDYIWGSGKAGLQCQDCNLMFHKMCGPYSSNHKCDKQRGGYIVTMRDVPIIKWSVDDVLNWMAVTHLYRYADLFKKHHIDGQQLVNINQEALDGMGIKDDFNQQCILYSRNELVTGDSRRRGSLQEPAHEDLFPSNMHCLQERSFSSLHWCGKCRKFMFGMTHQGLQCSKCNLICHRTCAATGLPKCDSHHTELPLNSSFKVSVFGTDLREQFPTSQPAPTIVIKCVEAIEHHGLETKGLYRSPCSMAEINELRNQFDANPEGVDFLRVSNVHCITGLLKRYLRELPNPVIEFEMYDAFMATNVEQNESIRVSMLLDCVANMQSHHRSTLSYIMAHLCRICQLSMANNIYPKHLASVFCHMLLRPPHSKIMHIIHNTEAQKRLLMTLIEEGDWGIDENDDNPPEPPPRQNSSDYVNSSANDPRTVEEADWYWGDISKEDVNEKMKDMPDGTFLVRDASNKQETGDYTLTLRKGGSNKLIKICHRNGMYGFSEPLRFTSVVELIRHYRNVSLAQYNAKLDINLTNPVSKRDAFPEVDSNIDMVINKLIDKNKEYLEKTQQYDKLYDNYSKSLQTIQTKRQALEAFNETVNIFTEQQELHQRYHKDCLPQEKEQLMENYALLQQRLREIKTMRKGLEEELKTEVDTNRERDRTMNSIKPLILDLRKLRDQYIMWLGAKGVKQDQINTWLSMENLDKASITDSDSLPHHNESLWLTPEVSRTEAEGLLWNKAKGTFLIRHSSQVGDWACSIVAKDQGEVRHCKINHTQTGYGFAEPYNLYSSLKELVLAYQQNSLMQHNEELDTRLAYPVYGPQPPQDVHR